MSLCELFVSPLQYHIPNYLGAVLTQKEEGSKYYRLLEESDKIKKGKVTLDGISGGPVDDSNLYHWTGSIFGPDGSAWEGALFYRRTPLTNVHATI